MKHQSCSPSISKLRLHHDSRVISKVKPPKIRIIHLVAPEIINTDTAHFRELVQALTGRPAPPGDNLVGNKSPMKKEEELVWTSSEDDSSNELWNEFVDFDGFIQQISPGMSKSPPRYHLGLFGDHPHTYH